MATPVRLTDLGTPAIMGCIYGAPGVGKTILSCCSQKLRTLLLDIDEGALSARCWRGQPGSPTPAVRPELVSRLSCSNLDDVLAAHAYLLTHAKDYDLVVLDTGTELQRQVLTTLKSRTSLEVPSQREWGIMLDMMDDLMRAFKKTGKHVIVTAHEMLTVDEYERRPIYRPAFQGQFRDYYARHFSWIARYVEVSQSAPDASGQLVRQSYRALHCQGQGTCHTKDRSGALDVWEPPDLDAVFEKYLDRVTQRGQVDAKSNSHDGGPGASPNPTAAANPTPAANGTPAPAANGPAARRLVTR